MRSGTLSLTAAVSAALLIAAPLRGEEPKQPVDVPIKAHIYQPMQLEATDQRIEQLRVPEGFTIRKFAEDLVNPRIIAIDEDGTVYVTRRKVGDVLMLRDTNGDGRADEQRVVAERPDMHGIAIDRENRRMYLANVKNVFVADIKDDGTLGELDRIIDDLPDGGQHPNRTLAVGPDGKLYISIGSSCNACEETNPEHATILRAEPDGSSRTIFAAGLRNTLGFGWHPDSGEIWGFDHGIDWLGDEIPHEEFNRIEQGKNYGWPFLYDDNQPVPHREPPSEISHETWAEMSEKPVLMYTSHAAGMQLAFYTGDQFPKEFRGDAFVTMRGSWNRNPPAGYELVRVRFDNGKPQAVEPFISGFLVQEGDGYGHIGRLVGCAQAPDGSLFICDDTNGVMYRITYDSGQPQRAADVVEGDKR